MMARVTERTMWNWLRESERVAGRRLVFKRFKNGRRRSCVRLIDARLSMAVRQGGGVLPPQLNEINEELERVRAWQAKTTAAILAVAKALGIDVGDLEFGKK